jgi:hypothetical protein
MATLKSTNINAGDPVTADIINNLVLDLNELNKSTAASFSLSLASTGGATGGTTSVSQKVYSTTKNVKVTASSSNSGATWTFPKDAFKSAPRCWVQVRSSGSLVPSQLNFTVIITSVSATSMTFRVRGPGKPNQTDAQLDFDCFAVESL